MFSRSFAIVFLALTVLTATGAKAQKQATFLFPVYGQNWSDECQGVEFDGYKANYWHVGSDILPRDDGYEPYIIASNAGQIWSITKSGKGDHDLGNTIIMRHSIPVSSKGSRAELYTQYSHLRSIDRGLYVGKWVKRGQIIGIMGGTGKDPVNDVWAVHLHFEMKWNGVLHNPWYYPNKSKTQYWGYTPKHPLNYGWVDPYIVIGSWKAYQ